MKTLTASALTEIAQQYATEPICIVEIDWGGGSVSYFSDREIVTSETVIPSKILSIDNLQTYSTPQNTRTFNVSVMLDDTDGFIKDMIDTRDIHKQPCTIYSWYGDLTLSDKFVLYKGEISSPFTWGEGDRQINFNIVSELESYEVGFSPEESQLDFVSYQHLGKVWPLVFGHVVHVPAQKVHSVPTGQLEETLCQRDPLLAPKLELLDDAYQYEKLIWLFWKDVLQGANEIAPTCVDILDMYVAVLKEERALLPRLEAVQKQINAVREGAKAKPDIDMHGDVETAAKLQKEINEEAARINFNRLYVERLIWLAEFEYNTKKRAFNGMIDAYNRMKDLESQRIDIYQAYCEQDRCIHSTVKVRDLEDFGTDPVDVVLNNVRFRVQFDHSAETMTLLSGPIPSYTNLELDTWAPDDEECSDYEEHSGLDLIWLKQDPPPNLEGQWLLLKKRGGQEGIRHIIKVKKQDGRKVYLDLVKWANAGATESQPSGISLDTIVNEVVNGPQILGSFGSTMSLALLDPAYGINVALRPENELLIRVLAMFPEGLSKEELERVTKLVYIAPSDNLADDTRRLLNPVPQTAISDTLILLEPDPRNYYTIIGPDVEELEAVSGMILESWIEDYDSPIEEIPDNAYWEAKAGSSFTEFGEKCDIYVANILPSTIKAVHAYRTNDLGERYLAAVPQQYYTKLESKNLGSITVTALIFPQPLESISGENWEDTIYVTLESSVGPDVTEVLEYLIDTYTDKSANSSNFTAMSATLAAYPVNFALFTRPDALTEINRICWESRLAIYFDGDEFFLKYLAAEPTSDDTLTESDVLSESLSIEHTATESLVTRLTATYKKNYLPLEGQEQDPKIVLRHNVSKYGLHPSEEAFHIYNNYDLVLKSATFWLIRLANTWRKVTFRTTQTKVRLDLLDTLTLTLPDYADGSVKGVIESAKYDTDSGEIEFVVNAGIRSGERTQYPFFWPADISADETYPTAAEIMVGYAGGYGPSNNVTGSISCDDTA